MQGVAPEPGGLRGHREQDAGPRTPARLAGPAAGPRRPGRRGPSWRADRGSAILDQLTFADFLARGEFDRHLRRMRPIYRRRRDTLLEALARAPSRLPPDRRVGRVSPGHLAAGGPRRADGRRAPLRKGRRRVRDLPVPRHSRRRAGADLRLRGSRRADHREGVDLLAEVTVELRTSGADLRTRWPRSAVVTGCLRTGCDGAEILSRASSGPAAWTPRPAGRRTPCVAGGSSPGSARPRSAGPRAPGALPASAGQAAQRVVASDPIWADTRESSRAARRGAAWRVSRRLILVRAGLPRPAPPPTR